MLSLQAELVPFCHFHCEPSGKSRNMQMIRVVRQQVPSSTQLDEPWSMTWVRFAWARDDNMYRTSWVGIWMYVGNGWNDQCGAMHGWTLIQAMRAPRFVHCGSPKHNSLREEQGHALGCQHLAVKVQTETAPLLRTPAILREKSSWLSNEARWQGKEWKGLEGVFVSVCVCVWSPVWHCVIVEHWEYCKFRSQVPHRMDFNFCA